MFVFVVIQLTEDCSSLRKRYEESGQLQLKQMSLCSVDFTERFLWVQNLDLSHNQLRSTHGMSSPVPPVHCDVFWVYTLKVSQDLDTQAGIYFDF